MESVDKRFTTQKPSWENAPEWANFLAMDITGDWFWYEFEPELTPDSFITYCGYIELAKRKSVDWKSTLEKRG